MDRIEANGEGIAYERAGEGPPLVLIHSLGTSSWLWEEQIVRWRQRYDVLAFDARGHGASSCRGGFTVRAAAADIAAALAALDVGPAACVAISMGGPIVAHLVDLAPQTIGRLVVADSFAAQGEAGAARAEAVARSIRESSMEEYGARYAEETLVEDAGPALRERLKRSIAAMAPETYIEAARSVFTSDVRDLMRAIRVPTRVIVGARDQRTPPDFSREIAALVAGADYAEIGGARHLSNLDRPDAFHAAVDPFLHADA